MLVRQQPLHSQVSGVLFIVELLELQLSLEEEANGPEPLRTLMVVEAMRIICIDVVTSVVVVSWVKGLDTHATLLHQNILNILETDLSIYGSK